MSFICRAGLAVVLGAGLGCAHARGTREPSSEPLPAVWQDAAGVPLSSAAGGLLRPGAETLIQRRLVDLHLLRSGDVSGRLDDPTMAALREFQSRAGLAETGLPSYATADRLGLPLSRVFRAGSN
jgi:hypothetical protein